MRSYAGRILIRVPPEVHQELAREESTQQQAQPQKGRNHVEHATISAASAHRASPLNSIHNPLDPEPEVQLSVTRSAWNSC